MNLVALPAFSDNYIWLLHDGSQAVVVDPGDAQPVRDALDAHCLSLAGILVTHHHNDHVGGLAALRPFLNGPIHGPEHPAITGPISHCKPGQSLDLLGLHIEVIGVPGHTLTHLAYFAEVPGQAPVLFCGDALFSAGCGRLFEGTPEALSESLSRLAGLPGNTRVCCAHEYTMANLKFALAVEPDNTAAAVHLQHCRQTREAGMPTLPSTIDLERQINPFLRCAEPAVIAAASDRGADRRSPISVLAVIRQWKDGFR